MSWVHCNKCAVRKTGSNRFYITNCRHLVSSTTTPILRGHNPNLETFWQQFCNLCIDLTNPSCSVCTVKCKVLEINKDLPPSVKAIFANYDGQLAAYKESLKFQNDQTLSFIKMHKGYVQEYEKKKEDVIKMKEQLNALSSAIAKEHELIIKLRGAFRKLPG
jgi:hypothetical protein